ncbi:MAG: hypothetical protein C0457_06465 [Polymorphum sp.]|nr:hypothetical protein [Polymorphum sp.]
MIKIGKDTVDMADPCAVVKALKKVQLKLVTGALAETVEIDGERVTFTGASSTALDQKITKYQDKCDALSGKRSRFAKTIRYT